MDRCLIKGPRKGQFSSKQQLLDLISSIKKKRRDAHELEQVQADITKLFSSFIVSSSYGISELTECIKVASSHSKKTIVGTAMIDGLSTLVKSKPRSKSKNTNVSLAISQALDMDIVADLLFLFPHSDFTYRVLKLVLALSEDKPSRVHLLNIVPCLSDLVEDLEEEDPSALKITSIFGNIASIGKQFRISNTVIDRLLDAFCDDMMGLDSPKFAIRIALMMIRILKHNPTSDIIRRAASDMILPKLTEIAESDTRNSPQALKMHVALSEMLRIHSAAAEATDFGQGSVPRNWPPQSVSDLDAIPPEHRSEICSTRFGQLVSYITNEDDHEGLAAHMSWVVKGALMPINTIQGRGPGARVLSLLVAKSVESPRILLRPVIDALVRHVQTADNKSKAKKLELIQLLSSSFPQLLIAAMNVADDKDVMHSLTVLLAQLSYAVETGALMPFYPLIVLEASKVLADQPHCVLTYVLNTLRLDTTEQDIDANILLHTLELAKHALSLTRAPKSQQKALLVMGEVAGKINAGMQAPEPQHIYSLLTQSVVFFSQVRMRTDSTAMLVELDNSEAMIHELQPPESRGVHIDSDRYEDMIRERDARIESLTAELMDTRRLLGEVEDERGPLLIALKKAGIT